MAKAAETIILHPTVLRWARERAKLSPDELATRLKIKPSVVVDWERTGKITFRQADALAGRTYTPLGYLYLPAPPDDSLPIADFRTRSGDAPARPSPNLLDTVYQMQRRQAWMREELIHQGEPPLEFVGAYSIDTPPERVAEAMAEALELSGGWASAEGSWTDALRTLRKRIERADVLIVVNGVVGNNTHRKLDVDEFQGFALVDEFAPLIFVNNADYKTAQIFTVVHELAHIFVGESGLSKFDDMTASNHATDKACDKIAAEFLAPTESMLGHWDDAGRSSDPYNALARRFKVSSIVVARRALDLGLIGKEEFFEYYNLNKANNWSGGRQSDGSGGGNFWRNQDWRMGARFGEAVSVAVAEGRLAYTDAFRLTDLKGDTFFRMPEKMGFAQ